MHLPLLNIAAGDLNIFFQRCLLLKNRLFAQFDCLLHLVGFKELTSFCSVAYFS